MDNKEINMEEFQNVLLDVQNLSYIIQDNKLPFIYEKNFYRVKMPSQLERAEAEDYRNMKYVEFIQKPNCKRREDLLRILKENNVIDIEEFEAKKNKIKKQLNFRYMELAPKINEDKENIQLDIEKIQQLLIELQNVNMEISTHLAPSLEDRLSSVYLDYLVAMCTEKKVEDEKWEKVWKNFEEFQNDNSPLATRAIIYITRLLLHSNQFNNM